MNDLILKPVVFILLGEPGVDIESKNSNYLYKRHKENMFF